LPKMTASERALAEVCGLDLRTYREKIELYLRHKGMISITGRGRILTEAGMKKLAGLKW